MLFRNIPYSTANLLMVEVDKVSVALGASGVTRTIAVDVLNVFRQDRVYYWSSSQN